MRIVLVSPFAAELNALHQLLLEEGHDVRAVPTAERGLEVASIVPPAAFIADAQVIGRGLELICALAERGLQPRVILLSPRGSPARREDRVTVLTKPIDLARLRRHLADVRTEEAQAA
jgi:DNA-binding response OmpR family regulator